MASSTPAKAGSTPGRDRQLLEALEVVVEEVPAFFQDTRLGLFKQPRGKLCGFAREDCALGDKDLIAALAPDEGAPELESGLGPAARKDEDARAGARAKGLAADRVAIDDKSDREADAGHPMTVAAAMASVHSGIGRTMATDRGGCGASRWSCRTACYAVLHADDHPS